MPRIIVYPTSDTGVSSWLLTPDAAPYNNYSRVDDPEGVPDDDATYVSNDAPGLRDIHFHFAPPTIPAGVTITGAAVHYRAKGAVSTFYCWLDFLGHEGSYTLSSSQALTGAWADHEYVFAQKPAIPGEPSHPAAEWLAADFDGSTHAGLHSFGIGGTLTAVDVTQVYLAIDYRLPITWDDAIKDPRIPIHWLLTLTSGANVFRFAESPLDVNGVHYAGALKVTGEPEQHVDPYTAQASACDARVQLIPLAEEPNNPATAYPFDLSEVYAAAFISMSCELSLWAEGTETAQIKKRLVGYVDNDPAIDENGVLTLNLSDLSMRYDVALPRNRIYEDMWPIASENDWDAGVPILLGPYVNSPIPIINVQSEDVPSLTYGIIAQGNRQTQVDSVVDGNGVAVTFYGPSNVPDGDFPGLGAVTTVSWAWDSADPLKQLYANGLGDMDTAAGDFAGYPDQPLLHIAAQVAYVAYAYAGLPLANIDLPALYAAQNALPDYSGELQIGKGDDTTLLTVITDAARIMRGAIFFEADKLTFRLLEFEDPSVLGLVENENMSEFKVKTLGSTDKLLTKLQIHYMWGYYQTGTEGVLGTKFYRRIGFTPDNYSPFADNETLLNGCEKSETVETRVLRSLEAAQAALARMAVPHEKPRAEYEATGDRTTHNLRLYDTVDLTARLAPSIGGAGLIGKLTVITGITWGRESNKYKLLEC